MWPGTATQQHQCSCCQGTCVVVSSVGCSYGIDGSGKLLLLSSTFDALPLWECTAEGSCCPGCIRHSLVQQTGVRPTCQVVARRARDLVQVVLAPAQIVLYEVAIETQLFARTQGHPDRWGTLAALTGALAGSACACCMLWSLLCSLLLLLSNAGVSGRGLARRNATAKAHN